MPERPEVEAVWRVVEENFLGKKMKRLVVVDDSKVINDIFASDFDVVLLGNTIVVTHRKSKNLWLQLTFFSFHSIRILLSSHFLSWTHMLRLIFCLKSHCGQRALTMIDVHGYGTINGRKKSWWDVSCAHHPKLKG
ncbi:formamidopyrimidine-DNA glycosylase isoform X2 [Cannabis sativa]|uniref:formamidopyrimidine-DNA glycosylase isoform X2 n=1 Tax=Cannabis sativa TaxID=3483 RepID=UPI0029CA3E9A|nr:formamidopyrimidine-DNA glycosylase isoform X2 [Cannabis sativa]